jgi:RNA-directed DNA polymerase
MLDNIPMNKRKLKLWLKCGYMDKGMYNPTNQGSPQGGIISPTLANMALDGLQEELEKKFIKKDKVHYIRYADDIIITGATKELLEGEVKPLVVNFLTRRGLEMSEEKSKITHIGVGFDFLGFNIRKYNGKLLIKPAKANIKTLLDKVGTIVKKHKTVKTRELVNRLNPIIRGWGYYFRHVVSSKIFHYIDHRIWELTWQWSKRRHPKKSLRWIKQKYFQNIGYSNWTFKEKKDKELLFKLKSIPIRRHVKIRAEANPYDIEWKDYFTARINSRKCLKFRFK